MQRSASVNLTKTVDMLNTNSCWLWHLASFKLLLNSSGCVAASLKCSTFENPICMKNMDFGRFSSKAVILIIAAEWGLLFFSCALKCIYFTSFETCYFFLWSHVFLGKKRKKLHLCNTTNVITYITIIPSVTVCNLHSWFWSPGVWQDEKNALYIKEFHVAVHVEQADWSKSKTKQQGDGTCFPSLPPSLRRVIKCGEN